MRSFVIKPFFYKTNYMKNVTVAETTLLSEASLSKSTERLIILADEPGMGKTTTLTRIAELIKKQNPQMWVLKFDARQTDLVSEQVKTLEDFVNLLFKIDPKFDNPLTRCLLTHQLKFSEHVVLLWDAFDEIISDRQNILILFEFIKNETKAQIRITTRRHDQRILEDRLSTLAYQFKTLDEEEQQNFLVSFWKITSKLTVRMGNESLLEQIATKLIKTFKQSTKTHGDKECFISIPLTARMLADVFQEKLENTNLDFFFQTFNLELGSLYEQFTDRKYNIFLREKLNMNNITYKLSHETSTQVYNKEHGILALKELFKSREIENLIDVNKKSSLLNVLSRIGLIQGNEEPVNFIHRTFAEYFAGKWLAEQTKSSKEGVLKEIRKLVGVQLFKKEYGLVRYFYDNFLTQHLPLHKAALECDFISIAKLMSKNFVINKEDLLGRTVFHLAAQHDYPRLVQLLTQVATFKLVPDKLGKTALHYAAAFCTYSMDSFLINVDRNLGKNIFETPFNLDEEIGYSLFNNEECVTSKLLNTRDEAGRTPLYYAVDNENWYTACELLLHGANIRTLTAEHKRSFLLHFSETFIVFSYSWNPIVLLLFIYLTYDLCAKQGKIFENQQLRKSNPTFLFCYLISFLLEYYHCSPIPVLLRNVLDKNHCFQISAASSNLLDLSNYINAIRISKDNYKPNDADCLKFVEYLCEHGKEIEIELLEGEHKWFLGPVASFGFFETFRYLFEFGENETDVFRSENIKKYNVEFKRLFYSLENLNFDNVFFQNLTSATFKNFGWTRLHLAAMNRHVHSIEPFLNSSEEKNINHEDGEGYTPLTTAAKLEGRSKFIESFFAALKTRNLNDKKFLYEIVINKSNPDGKTALHLAIHSNSEDYASAKVLLKIIKNIGFDKDQLFNIFSIRDSSDSNPLTHIFEIPTPDEFKNNLYIQSFNIFSNRDSSDSNPLTYISEISTPDEFKKHLFSDIQSFNFSLDQCIEILEGYLNQLNNLIHNDIESSRTLSLLKEIESLPLKNNERCDFVSQVCERNNKKGTPLHTASYRGWLEVVHSLMKNGAIFNAYDKDEKTPLDLCNEAEKSFALMELRDRITRKCLEKEEKKLTTFEKIVFLLSSVTRLFELTADEQTIHVSAKLDELRKILNKIKLENWIESECILNARNREGKTLFDLSKHKEITDLLREFKHSAK